MKTAVYPGTFDPVTNGHIEKILKFQMPIEEKLKYADFVVDNNYDLKNLERQVEGIIKELNIKLL